MIDMWQTLTIQYKPNYGDLEYEEMPQMMFVIDSLGMLLTPTDVDPFQKEI